MISLFAGAAVAVSGVLFQAVLKNPLADPGIIGISSGAGFLAVLITAFLSGAVFFHSAVCVCGRHSGVFLRVQPVVEGRTESAADHSHRRGGQRHVHRAFRSPEFHVRGKLFRRGVDRGGETLHRNTWDDVHTLLPYVIVGLILALFFTRTCNLMALEDKTARSLGVNVNLMRIWISVIAVLLASISTAVVGAISFLGLIVPHMGRILVGSDHRALIPFSMLAGALTFLLADTVGRTVAAPYEVSASIIMSVIGGPFFIILLRRSKKYAA